MTAKKKKEVLTLTEDKVNSEPTKEWLRLYSLTSNWGKEKPKKEVKQ